MAYLLANRARRWYQDHELELALESARWKGVYIWEVTLVRKHCRASDSPKGRYYVAAELPKGIQVLVDQGYLEIKEIPK